MVSRMAWDCWFDATACESLLDGHGEDRQGRLEQAIELYRGDFMGNYDAVWCVPIRERLRMRYRDALVELGKLCAQEGKLDFAISILNRAVALDDLHEPAIQALTRLYTHSNQPRLALDLAHQFEQRLQDVLVSPYHLAQPAA